MKIKEGLCSLLTVFSVSLSLPSCAPSHSIMVDVQRENNQIAKSALELVLSSSVSTSTSGDSLDSDSTLDVPHPKFLSSSIDTLSLADSYDKNDNNIKKESIGKLESSSVLLFVHEKVKCTLVAFYESSKAGCAEGEELGDSYRWGSGVVLSNNRGTKQVVTNNHVLPPNNDNFSVSVVVKKKKEFLKVGMKVLVRDYKRDLALLAVEKENEEYLPPTYEGCIGTHFSRGDFLKAVGYSATGLSVISGRIHSIPYPKLIAIEGAINEGNSGAAVYGFDKGEPKMIGILTLNYLYGLEGVGGAVSSKVIQNFLKSIDPSMANKYVCKDEEKGEGGKK